MNKKVFLRSELVERSQIKNATIAAHHYHTSQGLASADWATSLIIDLDTAKDRVRKIYDAFSNAIHNYDILGAVKHELACIPVAFTLRESYKTGENGISQMPFTQAVNSDYNFEVGTALCPNSIFPPNISLWHENIKSERSIWACYPPDIAEKAHINPIKTWTLDDSLVDWLITFVKLGDPEAYLRVEELWDTEDMRYTFYFPTKFPNKEYVASIQSLSMPEQVHAFISQFAPVRTRHIVEHLGMIRQQTTKILKKLEKDNRIEKVRHGVYAPIC